MIPHKQRIKLAEWAGWKNLDGKPWGEGQTYGIPPGGENWHWQNTPDYPNDLNYIHELENKWIEGGKSQYERAEREHLLYVILHKILMYKRDTFRATAAQRCEALLKVLELWED